MLFLGKDTFDFVLRKAIEEKKDELVEKILGKILAITCANAILITIGAITKDVKMFLFVGALILYFIGFMSGKLEEDVRTYTVAKSCARLLDNAEEETRDED